MSQTDTIREVARAQTRQALADSPGFRMLEPTDQREIYRREYSRRYQELASQAGLVPVGGPHASSRAMAGASDDIDDSRHKNERIDQAGELAGGFIDEVDFPGFVRDLLEGVFDANLEVTLRQMEAYQDLLKTATASVSQFVKAIDDTAAFGYLVEKGDDDFGLDFDDEGNAQLVDAEGTVVASANPNADIGDNEVKSRIMDAKIQMAKEQRTLLRETILMGITRLVVEKGQVKASVLFDIKATERIDKADKAARKESQSTSRNLNASTGLLGKLVGGGGAGHTKSSRKTRISVSSAKSTSNTELTAKVAGSVDITFKSDYFELNRFADIYAIEAGQNPAQNGQAQPAGPAPAAAG